MNVLKGGVSKALGLDREESRLGKWHQEEGAPLITVALNGGH